MAVMEHLLKFLIVIVILVIKDTNGEYDVEDPNKVIALLDEMRVARNFRKVDDMILSPKQYDVLFSDPGSRKNGYRVATRLWADATVPYQMDSNYTLAEKALIRSTLKIFEEKTCLHFKELTDNHTEKDYVSVENGEGCASMVGYWSGEQIIHLNRYGCMDVGRISHEFLHVLGFFHMHTTIGRDNYVTIMWENITPSTAQNFITYDKDISMYGTEYDFDSVTHYHPAAFTKNGKPTIVTNIPGTEHLMGQRNHLSQGDIIRVNRMYNCAK